jgi:GAF domain-containing protein
VKPPLPPDEAKRLEALAGYRVLDSPQEDSFDDITRLAAYVCEAPTAFISLVDRDRQWFKSRVGSDSRETSRDVSFCAHAILEPHDIMLVSDARTDPRFADNPLVTNAGGIRFYAGAPLRTACGHVIGSLCVIDTRPRTISGRDIKLLQVIADGLMSENLGRDSLRLSGEPHIAEGLASNGAH